MTPCFYTCWQEKKDAFRGRESPAGSFLSRFDMLLSSCQLQRQPSDQTAAEERRVSSRTPPQSLSVSTALTQKRFAQVHMSCFDADLLLLKINMKFWNGRELKRQIKERQNIFRKPDKKSRIFIFKHFHLLGPLIYINILAPLAIKLRKFELQEKLNGKGPILKKHTLSIYHFVLG